MATYSYKAHGAGNKTALAQATPRAAALAYFAAWPRSPRCNVAEGTTDGAFFTVSYGRASVGEWPQQWKDVTKAIAQTLPDTARDIPEKATS